MRLTSTALGPDPGSSPAASGMDSCVRRNDGEKVLHGDPSGFSILDRQMDIIFGNYYKL